MFEERVIVLGQEHVVRGNDLLQEHGYRVWVVIGFDKVGMLLVVITEVIEHGRSGRAARCSCFFEAIVIDEVIISSLKWLGLEIASDMCRVPSKKEIFGRLV